jgi:hypothetical protein
MTFLVPDPDGQYPQIVDYENNGISIGQYGIVLEKELKEETHICVTVCDLLTTTTTAIAIIATSPPAVTSASYSTTADS